MKKNIDRYKELRNGVIKKIEVSTPSTILTQTFTNKLRFAI